MSKDRQDARLQDDDVSAVALVRKRPGFYVTEDGRFEIHGSGRTWTLDGTNDADAQELIRRRIPIGHRSLADAQTWLYGSVYEHGRAPWPGIEMSS